MYTIDETQIMLEKAAARIPEARQFGGVAWKKPVCTTSPDPTDRCTFWVNTCGT